MTGQLSWDRVSRSGPVWANTRLALGRHQRGAPRWRIHRGDGDDGTTTLWGVLAGEAPPHWGRCEGWLLHMGEEREAGREREREGRKCCYQYVEGGRVAGG